MTGKDQRSQIGTLVPARRYGGVHLKDNDISPLDQNGVVRGEVLGLPRHSCAADRVTRLRVRSPTI
jgi:hypothetical protein